MEMYKGFPIVPELDSKGKVIGYFVECGGTKMWFPSIKELQEWIDEWINGDHGHQSQLDDDTGEESDNQSPGPSCS